jgi:hypothetical protein
MTNPINLKFFQHPNRTTGTGGNPQQMRVAGMIGHHFDIGSFASDQQFQ